MRHAPLRLKTAVATEKSLTPMALFEPIVRAYLGRGMDPAGALAAAQIKPTVLENPLSRISAWQMERLSGHAMRELDDESLGWSRRRLPWGSYGMLIRASLSAPTLGVALKRWCRHHGLICDNLSLHLDAQGACVVLTEVEPLGDLREFCMVSLLRNLHGVACWLIDSRMALQRCDFPYPEPAHADVYPLIFPGPIRFIASSGGLIQARLWFDQSYLELPIRRDEKALRLMLQRALPLQVLPYRRDRLLLRQVRQALLNRPEVSRHAAALAAVLGLSVRTLHRQLREEGTSLQALKDEVRQDQACEWLQRSEMPIKQIAEKVGFLSEKSFIRAFKTWTGQSPAAWRSDR
jgi:AraC-like DNA-binding protein